MQINDYESRIKWVYFNMQQGLNDAVFEESFSKIKILSRAMINDEQSISKANRMADIVDLLYRYGKIDFNKGDFDNLVCLLEQTDIPAKRIVTNASEEIIQILQESNNKCSKSKERKVKRNNGYSKSKQRKISFINDTSQTISLERKETKLERLDFNSSSDEEGYKYESLPSIHNEVLLRKPKRVAKLLKNGIDVNLSCYGITALHLAVVCGSVTICKMLIDHGAVQHSIMDEDGKDCLENLIFRYCGKIKIRLIFYLPLEISIFSGNPKIVEMLICDAINDKELVSCARLAHKMKRVESLKIIFDCICCRIKQKYADRTPMKLILGYLADRKSEIMIVIYTPLK